MTLVEVAARLVNVHSGRHARGQAYDPPEGDARIRATAEALAREAGRVPEVTRADADALATHARRLRGVFDAMSDHDPDGAARILNPLLLATGARPQLDPLPEGGWHVHFHGLDDTLAVGWAAGCVTGLALALGSDLAGRMGTCAAARCDRVFIDTSKNGSRRYCSAACQNRTKTAAYRSRSTA